MKLDEQSAKDLEFDKIRDLLSDRCKSHNAKSNALKIRPFKSLEDLKSEFAILTEIKSVHEDDTISFPHPSSEDIDHALKLLDIENGVLILDELVKIYRLCLGTLELINFSIRHKKNYPLVHEACSHITSVKDVLKIIENVLSPKLKIKDDATEDLHRIRQQLKSNQIAINRNFDKALANYRKADVLGDVEETYYESRRLLNVVSAKKKKVKGKVHGVSSKGVYTYIEPEINVQLNKNQEKLTIEESNEVFKILKELTDELRSERGNLEAFQRLLVRFDLYNGKVILAKSYKGLVPKIKKDLSMYWRGAIHPLLLLKNIELKEQTVGQEFQLKKESRFLVISGPNAGGKSVTLKTVGLLQLMFQCGLFVPVDEVSEFCWFDNILSDIGDNQSIDNQLSTYSYRLSRMKYFLEVVNDKSLVLLDEFGSGSDPELGGAIAEVFYEELYSKLCFAVINTHYTNIKILTSSLEEAVNACMLFDTKELKPLYKLSVGQPGSSFTFEVAKLNGIPTDIISKAKEKVSESKVKLDALAISLQKEKSKFNKVNKLQIKNSNEARLSIQEYETKLEKLVNKANQQNRFFEQQSKFVQVGKKVFDLIKKFKGHKTNKALNEELRKFVAIEKSKATSQKNAASLDRGIQAPKLPKVKKTIKKEQAPAVDDKLKSVKLGDKVALKDYSKAATVVEIKGKSIFVQIGNFKIKTTISELRKIK